MEIFLHGETWIAILTLTILEVVLGIDNIIFISIVTGELPIHKQRMARNTGLSLAMIFRILLLLGITYTIHLQKPLFTIDFWGIYHEVNLRDLILMAGGIFLLIKSTSKIHQKIEAKDHKARTISNRGVSMAVLQIILLDIIFSFDSIFTAIGMTKEVLLMITAVVISLIIMMLFSGAISRFINKYPTLQILALSFLILIGFMLVVESFHYEVPKGYIYFAVIFSILVEMLNMRMRKKSKKNENPR
jgi:predicted tellurium resistance membrane protein TerC